MQLIDENVTHGIKIGWSKWRSATCDRRISTKSKGKLRTIIRLAMPYGSENWDAKVTYLPDECC